MKKKKMLKVIAAIVAFVLIGGILWFANVLVGNPISKLIARNAAQKYLDETYPGTDYYLDHVVYDFKFNEYFALVKSPSSEDSTFGIYVSRNGEIKWETHESVTSGTNTAHRIDREYFELVNKLIESSQFPYECFIGFGNLITEPGKSYEKIDENGFLKFAMGLDEMVLDKQYDVRKLGSQYGQLVIYIDSEEVSYEKAAEMMREIKRIFDLNELPFRSMDFTLEYPLGENGMRPDGVIQVSNFDVNDIGKEDFMERLKAADLALKEHYKAMDYQKEEVILDDSGKAPAVAEEG